MMTIGQGKSTVWAEMTRRGFLGVGGAGLGALGFGLSAIDAVASVASNAERSVILLLLVGGPSQLETWDPKPDAPADVRGPFRSIATNCGGVRICEHLPRMAARMDRVAVVRSMYHESAPIHETGYQLLQTGRLCRVGEEYPHFGSVVTRLDGARNGLPPFVVLPGPTASMGIDIPHGQSAGWLGAAYDPFSLAADQEVRRVGIKSFDPEKSRFAYGNTPFGQNCLMASGLVEAGVRVVTVNMFDTVFDRVTWDCHGADPFSTLDDYARELLPTFDQAFTALIDDLERRGQLETTLVVAAGEFGRTPRLNASGGRDHWPGVWSIVLAGGGVRGGQVVGASDANGGVPTDRAVTPRDLLATIYHSLGIESTQSLSRPNGESYPLIEDGAVIRELFG